MHCISISHKSTPIEVREKFAFSEEEIINFSKKVLEYHEFTGIVIISTCNRCEIYFTGDSNSLYRMEILLCEWKAVTHEDNIRYFFEYSGENAIGHLLRVTCGLDSMVIGEDEILRQVKVGYDISLKNAYSNHELNIIFQSAIRCTKTIKTDTKISNIPVSIGTLTANYVDEFLKGQGGNTVLIVGITGTMGNIVAKNLSDKTNCNIIGTSRNHINTRLLLTDYNNIKVVEYQYRYDYLNQADVVISATTSPHYTFTFDKVMKEKKSNGKKLFIDLAVPGDIDKEIDNIDGYTLRNIDYFQSLSKDNNLNKLKEVDKMQVIINKHLEEILKNIYLQNSQDLISNMSILIKDKGFSHFLYHLKETLSSEQLKTLLDSMDMIDKGV